MKKERQIGQRKEGINWESLARSASDLRGETLKKEQERERESVIRQVQAWIDAYIKDLMEGHVDTSTKDGKEKVRAKLIEIKNRVGDIKRIK